MSIRGLGLQSKVKQHVIRIRCLTFVAGLQEHKILWGTKHKKKG